MQDTHVYHTLFVINSINTLLVRLLTWHIFFSQAAAHRPEPFKLHVIISEQGVEKQRIVLAC